MKHTLFNRTVQITCVKTHVILRTRRMHNFRCDYSQRKNETLILPFSDENWLQANLPVKDGGLGFRSVVSLASSVSLASPASTNGLQSASSTIVAWVNPIPAVAIRWWTLPGTKALQSLLTEDPCQLRTSI